MARRPSQPHKKTSIGLLIEKLSFLPAVDTMLLEGVPPPDVAKYVQDEMGALKEVEPKALANALRARKKQREDTVKAFSSLPDPDIDDDDDDDGSEEEVFGADEEEEISKKYKPSSLAKSIYGRVKGGIKDLIELEALYLSQRSRIDRMVSLERRHGIFSKDVGREIVFAGELLMMRVKTKVDLGLDDTSEMPHLDLRRYSETTVGVLSNPESRHRVLSLLQRMARLGKLKSENPQGVEEEEIVLPLPVPPKKE